MRNLLYTVLLAVIPFSTIAAVTPDGKIEEPFVVDGGLSYKESVTHSGVATGNQSCSY
jgi:hypothetical protein